jgi:hypothetical protein
MLDLIHYITSSFSTPNSFCVFIGPKLKYASAALNSITSTNSSKLERVQRRFAALYYSRFFCGRMLQ